MGADQARDLSNSFITALLRYVERAGGQALVDAVLARADAARTETDGGPGWTSRDQTVAVAEAASAICGDPEIGRRAGEELFRANLDANMTPFILKAGSPGPALEGVISYGEKMARGRSYEIVRSSDGTMVVEARYAKAQLAHPFFCGLSTGYWAMVPSLFGSVGVAVETSCQSRGDDVCTILVGWDRGATLAEEAATAAASEADHALARFDRMQAIAEELTRSSDLPTLVDRILDAVDRILHAPRALVAVREDSAEPLLVRGRGLPAGAEEPVAALLLDGTYDGRFGSPVVAPLGSFGVLALLLPNDSGTRIEERQLTAFARHASAAVEAVIARNQAERSRATASSLLGLARTLADVTTEAEVAERLARAIPGLVLSDNAMVLRWDNTDQRLWPAAFVSPTGSAPYESISADDVRNLKEIAAHPTAFLLDQETASPFIAAAMAAWGERMDAIVPVTAAGKFLGLLCAGYREDISLDRRELFARLQGAADLAATALEKSMLLDQIRHQALHDALTGLPNRVLLEDRATQALRSARRDGRGVGMLFIDLDRFKNVNDSLGHKAGDELIKLVGTRLSGCLRASDTLARTGGDEFVVLLPDIDGPDGPSRVAEAAIAALADPFEVVGHSLYVSASIGVAVSPEDGIDYDALLMHADSAMYSAKAAERGTFARHAAGGARREERLGLEHDLRGAVERDEFTVLFQPQIDLTTLQLRGAECLVRWDHPRLGRLGPADFLPLAEESSLMPHIDKAVRAAAFAQSRRWQHAGFDLRVAVNLSRADLIRPTLADELRAEIAAAGADPALIELEVTETVAMTMDDLRPAIEALATLGVRIAIDDFGIGTSGLARLQELPVHTLKIDRSLVANADTDTAILTAIIHMAHELGLDVVAEGVETPEQAAALGRLRCDLVQGFLFCRPVAATEIAGMVHDADVDVDVDADTFTYA